MATSQRSDAALRRKIQIVARRDKAAAEVLTHLLEAVQRCEESDREYSRARLSGYPGGD